MKKMLFTVCGMLLCQLAISQTTSTLLRDTLSSNRISLSVSLQGGLSNLESVRIVLFEGTGINTLIVSESVYSVSENNPGDFYSLSKSTNGYVFGLGLFNAETHHCILYLKRENSLEEAITLN